MTLLFTPEELIQYLYKETSTEKTHAIEEALQNDWTLREKLEVLKSSTDCLDKIVESPRTVAVLNVLNYARETAVAESL
ncbi:MAG: hypothetical protein H7Y31_15565 [Chitinophagaceae bacterium]|nr:hypothetical protein [Chitinophagaceae bacterium]